jgi:hypothetical protein
MRFWCTAREGCDYCLSPVVVGLVLVDPGVLRRGEDSGIIQGAVVVVGVDYP